jgi:hypothetical protein
LDKEENRTDLHYLQQRRPRHNSNSNREIQPGSARTFKPCMRRAAHKAQNKGHRTTHLQREEADTHKSHLLQGSNGRDLRGQPAITNKLANSHPPILSRFLFRLIFVLGDEDNNFSFPTTVVSRAAR